MEPRGFVGGIYRISEWIMRLSVINILWIICAFPFFFILVSILLSLLTGTVTIEEFTNTVGSWLLILAVLAPFTFFPSTAAMFTVARKWVTGETDAPLFKTFFKGYKENFKQSILGGFMFSAFMYILLINFDYYSNTGSFIAYIFIAFLLLAFVALFNFFSMIVHYQMKTWQLVKNALLVSIGKPVRSFTTAILASAVLYVSFVHFQWLFIFFTGSVIAYIAYWNFNLIYIKLQEQVEEMRKNAEEEPEIAAEMDREDLVKTTEENNK